MFTVKEMNLLIEIIGLAILKRHWSKSERGKEIGKEKKSSRQGEGLWLRDV